jgi:hypothetical protein
MVRVPGIEPGSRPWEGRILATIRYPLVEAWWLLYNASDKTSLLANIRKVTMSSPLNFANPLAKLERNRSTWSRRQGSNLRPARYE